jgi:hypothetical protein
MMKIQQLMRPGKEVLPTTQSYGNIDISIAHLRPNHNVHLRPN